MLTQIAKGMWTTIKHTWKPRVTLMYPEQKKVRPPFFRGRHRLQRYEDGLERCVGCALCAAVCPSEAIYLEAEENDPANPVSAGERYASVYQIHLLRCIFCGFCEEACPEDAIVMGPKYELAEYNRESFVVGKDIMVDPESKGFGDWRAEERFRSHIDPNLNTGNK